MIKFLVISNVHSLIRAFDVNSVLLSTENSRNRAIETMIKVTRYGGDIKISN